MSKNDNKSREQHKAKEPVRIRTRLLAGGSKSIYLDSSVNGQRDREFLRMYLVPGKTPADKEQNRKTMEAAKLIQAQRTVELYNSSHSLRNAGGLKQKMLIVDYIKHVIDLKDKNNQDSTRRNYESLLSHIKVFAPKATLKNVDKQFCIDFIDYIKTGSKKMPDGKLSTTTQLNYIKMLSHIFTTAVREEIINRNPFDYLDKRELPKKVHAERIYLTIEEVKTLHAAPCPFPDIKDAFLFCCCTGLRFSDVKKLDWESIKAGDNGETMIVYTQKKTSKLEYLPLSRAALDILNVRTRTSDTDTVFKLQDNKNVNIKLKAFAASAGINKKVTFHVSRHTFATSLLSRGEPIDVVSKCLGHGEIRTTQVYAKVVPELLSKAVHKLDNVFYTESQ